MNYERTTEELEDSTLSLNLQSSPKQTKRTQMKTEDEYRHSAR